MVNNKLIKVCGMCEGENIREVESPDIDMIGFIFYPKSPRYLCEMPDYMPAKPAVSESLLTKISRQ